MQVKEATITKSEDIEKHQEASSMKSFDSIKEYFSGEKEGLLDKAEHKSTKGSHGTLYGILLMLFAVTLLAGSMILCKFSFVNNNHMDGFDYLLVRSPIMVIAAMFQVAYLKINVFKINPSGRKYLLLR